MWVAPSLLQGTVQRDMVQKPHNVPQGPGVYEFADDRGSPVYIGKAGNLDKRISTYFARSVSDRTKAMLSVATKVSWILCTSEQEALLLEREKIKKLQPPYNVKLREGTGYSGLAVSTDKIPKVYPWRGKRPEKAHVFGPYPQTSTRALVDALITVYKVRSCQEHVFKTAKKTQKACLLYETNQCLAPCLVTTNIENYDKACGELVKYLKMPDDSLTRDLEKVMVELSSGEKFERAGKVRDTIRALESLKTRQAIIREPVDVSAWAISRRFGFIGVCVVDVIKGTIESIRTYESMDNPHMNDGELYEYVVNNYSAEHTTGANVAKEQTMFTRVAKSRYEKELVHLAELNSAEAVGTMDTSSWLDGAKVYHALQGLERLVCRAGPIGRVECIDISHHDGKNTVGSLVVFDQGSMQPKEYRVVKLGTMNSDDYQAIGEMVTKRFSGSRLGLKLLPDLLLIDGGKGQVAAGVQAMKSLNVSQMVTLCGLAKRFEEIYVAGSKKPILLDESNDSLLLLMLTRNAAHSHALAKHRNLKNTKITQRTPLNIPGVGAVLESNLYKHFVTYDSILAASQKDLQGVQSIGPLKAQSVHRSLQEKHRDGKTTPRPV